MRVVNQVEEAKELLICIQAMLNFNILASGSPGPSPPRPPLPQPRSTRGFPRVGEHCVQGCKIRPFLMGDYLPLCLIFSSIPAMGERPLTLSDIFMGGGSACSWVTGGTKDAAQRPRRPFGSRRRYRPGQSR